MFKKSMTKIVLAATLAAAAGWTAVPNIANAINNPDGGYFYGFGDQFRTAWTVNKWVNFYARVNSSGCFLDTTAASSNTRFAQQAIVKCTGSPTSGFLDETGDSPITSVDDANYYCLGVFNDGEGIQWGVGITN